MIKKQLKFLILLSKSQFILFKYLKIQILIKKKKNFDLIEIIGQSNFNGFNYKIPGDISSCSFFLVLTLLTKNSKLILKNMTICLSRINEVYC